MAKTNEAAAHLEKIARLGALSDEYGLLAEALAPILSDSRIKKLDELKKEIQLLADEVTPKALADDFFGEKFTVHVTPKKASTVWIPGAMKEIHTKVGDEDFYPAVSMTLSAAKSIIPEKEVRRLTETDNTGARTITCKRIDETPQRLTRS